MSDLLLDTSPEGMGAAQTAYKRKCTLILERMFLRPHVRQPMLTWLTERFAKSPDPASLLHDDPLYVVGRYLGVSPTEVSEIEAALFVLKRYNGVPNSSQAKFEANTKRIIQAAGRPLQRSEIVRRLSQMGKPMAGKDPLGTAGMMLWRARETFINIRGAGYWLRDRPCPAVGYTPPTAAASSSVLP